MPAVSPGRLPATLEPHLCTLVPEAPTGDSWLHELKYDGWRLMARKTDDEVRLWTRGGVEWHRRLPRLVDAIRSLPTQAAWLDGELCHLDADGFPDFEAVMDDVRRGDESSLFLQVWDCPWLDGRDLTCQPLLERKERLSGLLADAPTKIRYTSHVIGNGPNVFEHASAMELEGIVSKKASSFYRAGQRNRDWRKVKAWRERTVVIGGLQFDAESRLDALLVGSQENGQLRYEGRVEFGLNRVHALRDRFLALVSTERPFVGVWTHHPRRVWLRPETQIEIRTLAQRPGRSLRHATLLRPL